VTVLARDPQAASDWYTQVLGFATMVIEEQAEDVALVLMQHRRSGVRLVLRHAPQHRPPDFPLFSLRVGDRSELDEWAAHLTRLGVTHGGPRQAHLGWALTLTTPEGVRIQLHTDDPVSGDDS
jgi:catechol-2,3-dioxygenase